MRKVKIIDPAPTKLLPENMDECHEISCTNCAAMPFVTMDDTCHYGRFLSTIEGKLDIKGE